MKRLLSFFSIFLFGLSAHPQVVVKLCRTCRKPITECQYRGRHPAPVEAEPSLPTKQKQTLKPYSQRKTVATPRPVEATFDASTGVLRMNNVTYRMVPVDGGTFWMGGTSGESDEKPVHEVRLSNFSIGQTEVTQELWEAVMGTNPSYYKGNKRPVESVSWDDCQSFIQKLNHLTGCTFRLPAEAEWEFAARGGTQGKGYIYSGSNSLVYVAWYMENRGSMMHHEVATKSPNELGLYDMSGNVWEWCQDWFGSDYYSSVVNVVKKPTGPTSGFFRVIRGGSWTDSAGLCRVANRGDSAPAGKYDNLGFRIAL